MKIYLCLHATKLACGKHVSPIAWGAQLCGCVDLFPVGLNQMHNLVCCRSFSSSFVISLWPQAPVTSWLSIGFPLQKARFSPSSPCLGMPWGQCCGRPSSFPGLAEREDLCKAGNEWGELDNIEVTLSGKYNKLSYFSCFQGNISFSPRADRRGYSSCINSCTLHEFVQCLRWLLWGVVTLMKKNMSEFPCSAKKPCKIKPE